MSRWLYELVISIGDIAKHHGFSAMFTGYDEKVLITLWFVHEDGHLVDEIKQKWYAFTDILF